MEELYLAASSPERLQLAGAYVDEVETRSGPLRNRGKGVLQSLLAGLRGSPRQPGDGLQQGLVTMPEPLEPLARFLRDLAAPPAEAASGR